MHTDMMIKKRLTTLGNLKKLLQLKDPVYTTRKFKEFFMQLKYVPKCQKALWNYGC